MRNYQKPLSSLARLIPEQTRLMGLLLFIVAMGFSTVINAQERFIKELGNRYTRKAYHNSLAIAVVNGDSSKVYTSGRIRPDQAGQPTKDSYYEIGGLTKLFTTLIFQDFINKGRLDPETPVRQYLPDSVHLTKKGSEPIRLRHLATHTSGLPRLDKDYFYKRSHDILRISQNPFKSYSTADLYNFLDEVVPFAEPGEKLLYSNMGMGLLGHILVKVSGKADYETLLADYTEKLGLSDTKITLTTRTRKMYLLPGYNRRRRQVPYWDFRVLAPVGAVKTTPNDIMKFLKISMGQVKTPLTPVMQQAQQIRDSGNLKDINDVKVGYGWFKGSQQVRGEEVIWQNAQTGGFSSFIALLPKQEQGVAVLANTNGGVGGVALRALKVLSKE